METGSVPQWVQVFIAGIVGLLSGAALLIKTFFTVHSRLQTLEARDLAGLVRDELAKERHDVLYPMLQTRVYVVLDKLEEEMKMQGQNIAVLLERDRTAASLKEIVDSLREIINRAGPRTP